jgi:hypothetical protein
MFKWGMAAVVVAAGVAGLSGAGAASASTAKAPCWVGSWEVTSAHTTVSDKNFEMDVTGGAGIKLKLTKDGKYGTAAFNFRKTPAQTGTAKVKGVTKSASLTLDQKLTARYTFGGIDARGKIALKPRSGSGDATMALKLGTTTTVKGLSHEVAKNRDLYAIPRKGTVVCVKNTSLVIRTTGKSGLQVNTTEWRLKHS